MQFCQHFGGAAVALQIFESATQDPNYNLVSKYIHSRLRIQYLFAFSLSCSVVSVVVSAAYQLLKDKYTDSKYRFIYRYIHAYMNACN